MLTVQTYWDVIPHTLFIERAKKLTVAKECVMKPLPLSLAVQLDHDQQHFLSSMSQDSDNESCASNAESYVTFEDSYNSSLSSNSLSDSDVSYFHDSSSDHEYNIVY